MNRSLLTTAALAGLIALTGCADLGYLGGNGRYGDYRRAPNDGYYGDYGRRGAYDQRRIDRDAAAYANEIDRYLRISSREERAIRDVLVRNTYRFLDRGGEYPFPRRGNRARSFWSQADRDIERILDRRYHEPYRYYNRYGGERYNDYYRTRRYDTRRGWYDTREYYEDGRRREVDRRRDNRQDRRQVERERDRRERARRAEQERDRRERIRRDQRERDQRERARRDQRERDQRQRAERQRRQREEARRDRAREQQRDRARRDRSRRGDNDARRDREERAERERADRQRDSRQERRRRGGNDE